MSQEARSLGQLANRLAVEGHWSEALVHGHACYRLAPAGSSLSVWALHLLACVYADAGQPRKAQQFARLYLTHAPAFPELERFTPFVLDAMGSACYQRRDWLGAFRWYNKALIGFAGLGNTAKAAVATHHLVWSLVRAGRPDEARTFLADRHRFPADLSYLFDGAMAAILGAEGYHQAAIVYGRRALSASSRRSFDTADAAEVALIVAHALRSLGENTEASAYIKAAAELCALQQWDAVVYLLLNERAEGGDSLHESAASSRGSADLRHRGCFSTGVA